MSSIFEQFFVGKCRYLDDDEEVEDEDEDEKFYSIKKESGHRIDASISEGKSKKRKVAFHVESTSEIQRQKVTVRSDVKVKITISKREPNVVVVEGSAAPVVKGDIPVPKGERNVAVVEETEAPVLKVNIPVPKKEIRPQMKIEGEQSCHKMHDDFPYQVKFRGYYCSLLVSENTYNTFGGSKRGHEATLIFRLNKDFVFNELGSNTVEVSTKEVSNLRLVNFKLDLSDKGKQQDAELTLRLIFLFLKIAFPISCKTFENCAFEQKDRHQGCNAKCLKAFFKRIDFFQLDDLAMEVFQPTVKEASADFVKYLNGLPFENELIPRYKGVPLKRR